MPAGTMGHYYFQMEIEMKKIILAVFTTLILLPCASFAQERTHDETILVLRSTNFEYFEDVLVDCTWAIPFLPMDVRGGWRSDLYSLETNSSSAIVEGDVEKIGEMWTCYDVGQEIIDPALETFENGIAYAIFIDGETLGALGTVRGRGGFPTHNTFAGSASVSRVVDGLPEAFLGSMTVNEMITSDSDLYGGSNSIVTLRLYTPRDYNREAFLEAIERAFGG